MQNPTLIVMKHCTLRLYIPTGFAGTVQVQGTLGDNTSTSWFDITTETLSNPNNIPIMLTLMVCLVICVL